MSRPMPGCANVALPKVADMNTFVIVVRSSPVTAVRAARPRTRKAVTAMAPRIAIPAPKMLAPR